MYFVDHFGDFLTFIFLDSTTTLLSPLSPPMSSSSSTEKEVNLLDNPEEFPLGIKASRKEDSSTPPLYSCDLCGGTKFGLVAFLKHQKTHINDSPYKCSYPGRLHNRMILNPS